MPAQDCTKGAGTRVFDGRYGYCAVEPEPLQKGFIRVYGIEAMKPQCRKVPLEGARDRRMTTGVVSHWREYEGEDVCIRLGGASER